MLHVLYRKSIAVANSTKIFFWSFCFLRPLEWMRFWFTFPKELIVQLDNLHVVLRTKTPHQKIVDLYMAASCILSHQYTHGDFGIRKKDTVIDIGAHIGSFSIFAARDAQGGKVYSFEPDPANFAQLTKNINANRAVNVTASQRAVYATSGEAYLSQNILNSAERSLYQKGGKRVRVPTTTLLDIFSEYNIATCNLLKLDCEGAEYDILFGAPRELFGRIEKIVMECHTPSYFNIENPKYTPENMLAHLNQCGFETNIIYENRIHGLIFAKRKSRVKKTENK